MIANLSSVNEIGAAVALEDFARVDQSARILESAAQKLLAFDISEFGIEAKYAGAFSSFLRTQEELAKAIRVSAGARNEQEIMLGLQRMMNEACVSCHNVFREPYSLLRPSVAIMTSFLSAWQSINRGVLINDFSLVEENAALIQSTARIFNNDAMIEPVFGIQEADERRAFRKLLHRIQTHARQVEEAAIQENSAAITSAAHQMWIDGCIACHRAFR
jgi:cytochrome c556